MPKILQVDQFYKFKYIIIQGLSVTVTVLGRQKRVTVAGVSLYPTVFSTECWSQGRAMYSYSIISVSL